LAASRCFFYPAISCYENQHEFDSTCIVSVLNPANMQKVISPFSLLELKQFQLPVAVRLIHLITPRMLQISAISEIFGSDKLIK
jgi:hypothetical protein